MKHCRRFRKSLLGALYNELTSAQHQRLEEHLQQCQGCSDELANLRQTLRLLELRESPDPEEDYWAQAWDRFVRSRQSVRDLPGETRLRWRRFMQPQWVFQAAAAMALVFLGVWIGRFLDRGDRHGSEQTSSTAAVDRSVSPASLDDRLDRYLERSKLVLLGVGNLDLRSRDVSRFDFSPEKRLCRELATETSTLKQELEGTDDQRMLELISELEVILLQISNLQQEQEALGMELVQTGIRHNALLFQINLEEIQRARKRDMAQKGKGRGV